MLDADSISAGEAASEGVAMMGYPTRASKPESAGWSLTQRKGQGWRFLTAKGQKTPARERDAATRGAGHVKCFEHVY